MVDPKSPNEKPGGVSASAALQVAIAVACALVVAAVVDWVSAVHVLLAVLSVFTSVNRAARVNRRCARCGYLSR